MAIIVDKNKSAVQERNASSYCAALLEAFEDARLHSNLYGSYETAEEAVAAMLED